jgi:RNA polymerase sigma factor (sigma-70 family)
VTLTSAGATVVMYGERLTPHEQSTLAERIRRREAPAEDEFVHLFSAKIAFLVRSRTRDREAARDLTQEVLLAVVLALRNGHLREAERLAAFVYGTARNVINNYLRTRSRQPREDPINTELHPANIQEPLEGTEREALVRNALGVLDSIDRKILLLTLVEGLKPGEIADRVGLTSEVVRTRKSRALKKAIERVKTLSQR